MSVAERVRTTRADGRLRTFVNAFAELVLQASNERAILSDGRALLGELVARDDWLPADYAVAAADGYCQYLLHCDSRERFSVVSFVWGPGQSTPVHDHRVWGLAGVLRGEERIERFRRDGAGRLVSAGAPALLKVGEVDAFSPRIGDIHRVSNARIDQPSISIHVYGANIGTVQRSVYDDEGRRRPFVSGYADVAVPNLWRDWRPQ